MGSDDLVVVVDVAKAVMDPIGWLLDSFPKMGLNTQRLYNEGLLDFMGFVRDQLRDLDRAKVTPEEAFEIAAQIVRHASATLDNEKRARMKKVLAHGLSDEDLDGTQRRLFVRLVSELETEHILLLEAFDAEWGAWDRVRDALGEDCLDVLLQELISRKLVNEVEHHTVVEPLNTGQEDPVEIDTRTSHNLSTAGRRFVRMLEDGSAD